MTDAGFAQGAASVQPPANGEKWVKASELESAIKSTIGRDELETVLKYRIASAVLLPSPALPSNEGDNEPCYYCQRPCDSTAARPDVWPIPLCHTDDPGVVKWHHIGCVTARLVENQPSPTIPAHGPVTSGAQLTDLPAMPSMIGHGESRRTVDRAEIVAMLNRETCRYCKGLVELDGGIHKYYTNDESATVIGTATCTAIGSNLYDLLAERCGWVK